MIGVVKANAYGSAIDVIANKLVSLGIDALAVAYTKEGVALRRTGIQIPIIVFYPQIHNFKKIIYFRYKKFIS